MMFTNAPLKAWVATEDGRVVGKVELTDHGARDVYRQLMARADDRPITVDDLTHVTLTMSADDACDLADDLSDVIGADADEILASIEAEHMADGWRELV